MTLGMEAVISPILSTFVVGLASFMAVRVNIAKVTQRMDDRVVADAERHAEYCRRFDRIERRVGISNGAAEWVDREFCREVHRNTTSEITALRREVHEAAIRAGEAVEVAKTEADGIKERLMEVEASLKELTSRR